MVNKNILSTKNENHVSHYYGGNNFYLVAYKKNELKESLEIQI